MLHCNFLPAASNNTLTPFAFVACRLTLKTKHFKLQYCTLLHQYCTKCAIQIIDHPQSKIQTKLLLANPYANIEGQRIVVIPQQCKQRRTL